MTDTHYTADPLSIPWWRRVRSGLLLVGLCAVLGVSAAAALGIAVVTILSLLDNALG